MIFCGSCSASVDVGIIARKDGAKVIYYSGDKNAPTAKITAILDTILSGDCPVCAEIIQDEFDPSDELWQRYELTPLAN